MTDFTNCPIVPGRAYNGANGSKIAVEYNGEIYMLKFPPSGERKPTNLSYTNSCISEHLASSIFNLIGINAQKTELGTFSIKGKTKVVCACKDFATGSKRLFDFCSIKNTILDSDSNGSGTELEDVMDTIDKQRYVSPVELREHFWNVFIVDALLGNFDPTMETGDSFTTTRSTEQKLHLFSIAVAAYFHRQMKMSCKLCLLMKQNFMHECSNFLPRL